MTKGRNPVFKIGDVFTTNQCGYVEIVGMKTGGYIIKFLNTGSIIEGIRSSSLRQGKIKDPLVSLAHNAYKHGLTGKTLKEYLGIVKRCNYDTIKENRKLRCRRYDGCYLHEDFDTVEKFAEWKSGQPFTSSVDYLGNSYQIDKDILVPGNFCYGPETCVYVPQQINGFFAFIQGSADINVGTSFEHKTGRYKAELRAWPNGKLAFGPYGTKEEAHQKYCVEKEKHAKYLAVHFAGMVDSRVVTALNNFSVDEYVEAHINRELKNTISAQE